MLKIIKKNKKVVISFGTILALLLLIFSVSYAAFDFDFIGGENIIKSSGASIEFLEGTDTINLINALPMNDTNGKNQEDTFDFAVTTNSDGNMDIAYSLMITELTVDSGYTALNSDQIKVYLTDEDDNVLLKPTLISDLNDNGTRLYTKVHDHTSTNQRIQNKYKLRVWLNQYVDITDWDKDTKLQYKFKIGVKTHKTLDTSGANAPVLSQNMIPVYYDESCDNNTGCWRKADAKNQNSAYMWYDYDSKMWANSVTVSSASRSSYLAATEGTKISMDDILTMQVWIPRYKYKVWNYNLSGTVTSNPQEIQITFEKGTEKTGDITCTDNVQGTSDGTPSGTEPTVSEICKLNNTNCTDDTCNNKTYTHPAFTFGDKELTGFWVGKFENSSDITCTVTNYAAVNQEGTCNVDTIRPLIKPNVTSWRGAMVSVFENNMMAMNDSENKYGFASTDDTHMIKNMEWGAVAYLSHSKYGINKEIAINSADTYTTGCGPQSEGSTSSGSKCNAYNTSLGQSSSATGNVYGIYDMSGGAYDYVMGNIVSPDGEAMMSGNRADTSSPNYHSGYDGILYYKETTSAGYGTYDGIYSYPDNKYIDKYSFNTGSAARGRSKLGDGIREVLNTSSLGWYSDYSGLASSQDPWFLRGGYYFDRGNVGGFSSYNYYGNGGNARTYTSSRLVISQ